MLPFEIYSSFKKTVVVSNFLVTYLGSQLVVTDLKHLKNHFLFIKVQCGGHAVDCTVALLIMVSQLDLNIINLPQ